MWTFDAMQIKSKERITTSGTDNNHLPDPTHKFFRKTIQAEEQTLE